MSFAVWWLEHNAPSIKTLYTNVDLDPLVEPDSVFDITQQEHWQQFKEASFDFIFFESTPFLDGMEQVFTECLRVLKPNGMCITVVVRITCLADMILFHRYFSQRK